MTNALELSLTKEKEVVLNGQEKNIINNISEAFSNAVKKGTDKLSFPDNFGERVKEGFEKIDLKEIGGKAAESALKEGMKSLGMKSSTFSNIKGIFKAIKEGNLKDGLSSGLNTAIEFLPVPKEVKNIIKEGKNLILDQTLGDELKNVMKKQQNTISRINKKCIQMTEAFEKNDGKTLDRVYKTLKKDVEKVMPIENVIKRGMEMLNRYELYKNKGTALSSTEIELCQKLSYN